MGLRLQGGAGALVELASGVDALYLSGRADVSATVAEALEERRALAADTGNPVPLDIGGVQFGVAGHGWGKYRFCLTHQHGQVGITTSGHLPAVRVQPRAEFLHGIGPLPAVDWFGSVVSDLVGPTRFSTSRIDLHSDWQGWIPHGDERRRFVCRADRRDLHEEQERLTGLEFGRRTSGTICARIYDKTAQIDKSGADYWDDIWGPARDPSLPVLRVEFELGRSALREFYIDSPGEAVEAAGALWASVTTDWLTYRCPTGDSERSRWPIAPEWLSVQRASLRSSAAGLKRMYEGRRRGSLRTLMPALNGYLARVGALQGTTGIDDTCELLPGLLREYEVRSRTAFSYRVGLRRVEAAFR